jgi:ribosomal protein L37AE/L43A
MTRFGDERAPLEMTKVSNKQKIMVCPECKVARSTSINTYGLICSNCGTYFNQNNSLSENAAENYLNQTNATDFENIKYRESMEKKAYDFRDKTNQQKKAGTLRSHEPSDVKRLTGKS